MNRIPVGQIEISVAMLGETEHIEKEENNIQGM